MYYIMYYIRSSELIQSGRRYKMRWIMKTKRRRENSTYGVVGNEMEREKTNSMMMATYLTCLLGRYLAPS